MAKPKAAFLIAKNLADNIREQIEKKQCLFESCTVDGVTEPVQPTHSIDGREYTNQTNMFITLVNSMFKPSFGYKYATRQKIKKLGGWVKPDEVDKGIIIEKNFMMYVNKPGEKANFWPFDKDEKEKLKKKGVKPFWVRNTQEVFNVKGQTEALPDKYYPQPITIKQSDQKFIMDAQYEMKKLFKNNNIDISHKVCTPHVNPVKGKLNIPTIDYFNSPEQYFSTLLHECVHYAGLPNRLGFLTITPVSKHINQRPQQYAHEELRAEFGSVYMCAHMGFPYEQHMDSHAAYCKGYLKLLDEDPELILDLAKDVVLTGNYMKNNRPEMQVFYNACQNDFEKHLVSMCIASGKDVESQIEKLAEGKEKGLTRLSKFHMSSVAMNYPDKCGVDKSFEYTTAVTDEQVKDMRMSYRESAKAACAKLMVRVEDAFDMLYEQGLKSESEPDHSSKLKQASVESDSGPSHQMNM